MTWINKIYNLSVTELLNVFCIHVENGFFLLGTTLTRVMMTISPVEFMMVTVLRCLSLTARAKIAYFFYYLVYFSAKSMDVLLRVQAWL